MGSFILATTGYPQNATYQSQFANAFNGATAVSVALYNTTGPALALVSPVNNSGWGLAVNVAGDANPRGILLTPSGDATLYAQTSAGVAQANLYNSGATTTLVTDQGFTAANGMAITGALTSVNATTTNGPSVGGAFVAGSTGVNARASALASGGNVYPANQTAAFTVSNTSGDTWMGTGTSGRGFTFQAITSAGTVVTPAHTNTVYPGVTALMNGFLFGGANGVQLSRVSSASAPVPYHAPSYGNATVSHGLGATPDYAVTMCGDGGGFSNTFFQGFDTLGSSTLQMWASMTGGTYYMRCFVYKKQG